MNEKKIQKFMEEENFFGAYCAYCTDSSNEKKETNLESLDNLQSFFKIVKNYTDDKTILKKVIMDFHNPRYLHTSLLKEFVNANNDIFNNDDKREMFENFETADENYIFDRFKPILSISEKALKEQIEYLKKNKNDETILLQPEELEYSSITAYKCCVDKLYNSKANIDDFINIYDKNKNKDYIIDATAAIKLKTFYKNIKHYSLSDAINDIYKISPATISENGILDSEKYNKIIQNTIEKHHLLENSNKQMKSSER